MTTPGSRDNGWMMHLADPLDAGAVRALFRGVMMRLDAIDRNASGVTIPPGFISQAMLAPNSVGSAQIQADAVGSSEIAAAAVGPTELAAGAVETAAIAALAVTTAKIGAAQVTKAKLAGGFSAATVIAGGAAGAHTVAGIATGDQLVLVTYLLRDAVAANIDMLAITGEFTITGANTIDNTAGTDTTGFALLVFWLDLT